MLQQHAGLRISCGENKPDPEALTCQVEICGSGKTERSNIARPASGRFAQSNAAAGRTDTDKPRRLRPSTRQLPALPGQNPPPSPRNAVCRASPVRRRSARRYGPIPRRPWHNSPLRSARRTRASKPLRPPSPCSPAASRAEAPPSAPWHGPWSS